MNRIPIGEAARRLGTRTSTLRYYEERGLVRPAARVNGKRMYDEAAMRRLAFLQLARKLGIPLDTAAAVLDEDSQRWRGTVQGQVVQLEEMIARALGARDFLVHALECPAEHPVDECPHMRATLDRLLEGMPLEELAARRRDPPH